METFSALLVICAGNSPALGEFLAQRPVTRSFDVYFDLHPNKRLSKQWWGWWFETQSWPLWRHCNEKGPVVTDTLESVSIWRRHHLKIPLQERPVKMCTKRVFMWADCTLWPKEYAFSCKNIWSFCLIPTAFCSKGSSSQYVMTGSADGLTPSQKATDSVYCLTCPSPVPYMLKAVEQTGIKLARFPEKNNKDYSNHNGVSLIPASSPFS